MWRQSTLCAVWLAATSFVPASVGLSRTVPHPSAGTIVNTVRPDQRRAFFGELHLHTAMSFDAWTFGTKIEPDQAYRFGRGETVMVPGSQVALQQGIATTADVPAKRAWPLDFMAVTDHAEFMGVLNQLDDPDSGPSRSPIAQQIRKNPGGAVFPMYEQEKAGHPGWLSGQPFNSSVAMQSAWATEIRAANDNYQPGKFTTFIAYEWSSMPLGDNLHRNVIFGGGYAPLPFSSVQSERPEDLWSYLEAARAKGIDVIAIPHNADASNGMMFDWNRADGRPIDEAYAQRRALNEPLTEIVQTKGQSETAPVLSPNDEFANFEVWDHLLASRKKSAPNGSYFRQALGRGLIIQQAVGANPFKLGVAGASDVHNGLSASDENAYASQVSGLDPKTMLPRNDAAKKALGMMAAEGIVDLDAGGGARAGQKGPDDPLQFGSAGLTGVWAEENTRPSIFAALKRKETFATSGTRMRVRMFAGWTFPSSMLRQPDWVSQAYVRGVPMGGDLPPAPAGLRPRFILQASKDPDGANLDRIQVIKVWLDGSNYKERVFNVALAGRRSEDPGTGRAPPVGNTVDLRTGRYANSIGGPILTTLWTDPTFDPTVPAVYYERAMEIPTPRWSTLLAIANRLPIPHGAAATIQERAWSSPIWYTPAAR